MSTVSFSYNENALPFFDIIMQGLKGYVDGESFWEAVAEDAIFEFCYNVPGFTNRFEGRAAYMKWFEGYSMQLHRIKYRYLYKKPSAKTVKKVLALDFLLYGSAA